MRAWIDQDLCTGDGLCTDHCPEVFVLLDDGISYVHDGDEVGNDPGGATNMVQVPRHLEQAAVNAALDCPGECIFLESDVVIATLAGYIDDGDDGDVEQFSVLDQFGQH